MDPATFKIWVSGIASLTDPQRRSVWQALALSEATTSSGVEALAASDPIAPAQATGGSDPVHATSTARDGAVRPGECCRPRSVPGGQCRLPTLRQPRRRALGPGERSAPLPL